jgi:hypothetical protein
MSTTRRKFLRSAALAGGGLAVGGGALAADAPKAAPGGDAAGLLALFAKRQTVRRYKMDPVPDEHLRLILGAARRAGLRHRLPHRRHPGPGHARGSRHPQPLQARLRHADWRAGWLARAEAQEGARGAGGLRDAVRVW